MELPKGKKGPKLPPKGRGGGAAARQRYLERQRGLEVEEGCSGDREGPAAGALEPGEPEAPEPAGRTEPAPQRSKPTPAKAAREPGGAGR